MKKTLIVWLFALVTVLNVKSVKASSYETIDGVMKEYNIKPVTDYSSYKYVVVPIVEGGIVKVYYTNDEITFPHVEFKETHTRLYGHFVNVDEYYSNTGEFHSQSNQNIINIPLYYGTPSPTQSYLDIKPENSTYQYLLYSKTDLVYKNQVFFLAPIPPHPPLVSQETMEGATTEVVGLIPLLIPLVVGLLGLRIGWRYVLQTLRQA